MGSLRALVSCLLRIAKSTWFLVKHAGVRGDDGGVGRDLRQCIRRLQGADFRLGGVKR